MGTRKLGWLKTLAGWILKDELEKAKGYVAHLTERNSILARQNDRLASDYNINRRRVRIFFDWLKSCDELRLRDTMGKQYILEGNNTSNRQMNTDGVHPATRWGFKTFIPFETNWLFRT
jgi:hypothetical protein